MVLTNEQLDRVKAAFVEARINLKMPEIHEEAFEKYQVFNNGKKFYLDGDDEELDEEELDFLFGEDQRQVVTQRWLGLFEQFPVGR